VLHKADGGVERFPRLVTDRAKPGVIAVNRAGQRFVNESDSYHCFVEAMFANGGANAPCWLICDSEALNHYGMGLAAAAGRQQRADQGRLPVSCRQPHRTGAAHPHRRGHTGADRGALQRRCRTGVDRQFGKGSNAYNRYMGDPLHQPNPCLKPLHKAPFYAVRVFTGDLGSAPWPGDQCGKADGSPRTRTGPRTLRPATK
jgi:hypothetical protein